MFNTKALYGVRPLVFVFIAMIRGSSKRYRVVGLNTRKKRKEVGG
jgi:hypothetical protein